MIKYILKISFLLVSFFTQNETYSNINEFTNEATIKNNKFTYEIFKNSLEILKGSNIVNYDEHNLNAIEKKEFQKTNKNEEMESIIKILQKNSSLEIVKNMESKNYIDIIIENNCNTSFFHCLIPILTCVESIMELLEKIERNKTCNE